MAESIIETVRRHLLGARGRWVEVARDSGVPYHTLTKIAQGTSPNPRIDSVQRLLDYFGRQPGTSTSSVDTVQPVTAVTEGAPAAEGGDERHHQEPIAFGNRRQREGTKADRGHTGGAA